MNVSGRGSRAAAALAALALAGSVVLGAAHIAGAEGAIEVNHAKALAGGVTASDAPGYPVTIDAPGSYVLTGNLQQPDPNVNAIDIQASDVVLDLGGFAITGTTVCTASCSPTGSGSGISGTGERIVVRDGSLHGLGNDGVRLLGLGGHRVEHVVASENGSAGIRVGSDGVIANSSASYNGTEGLNLADGTIHDSVSAHNLGVGVAIDSPTTVARTLVRANGGDGINVASGGRIAVRDCQIESNGGHGVNTLGGFFEGNRISGHGVAGKFGISARGSVAIQMGGNVLHANNGSDANPQISTSGAILQLGSNVCGSDLVCP